MVFILRIFTIEIPRTGENDYELLVIFGMKDVKIRIGESMRSSLVSMENLVIN